jgi:hypothetical protein
MGGIAQPSIILFFGSEGAPTASHGVPKKWSLLLGAEFGAKNLLNEVKDLLRAILSPAWTGRAFPASIRFR